VGKNEKTRGFRYRSMLKLNIEYFFLFSLIFFFSLISIFFILLSYILVIQQRTKEKTSSYECGFQPFMDTRSKFNIKYYVLAILFIIFDLELVYMIP
jgi:NADH-quinone oxidoreductase subunit A